MSIVLSLFFILLCLSSMHGSSKARHIGFDRGHKGFSAPLLHFGKGQFLFVDTFKPAVDLSTKEPVVQVKQGETIAADEEPLKGTHTSAKGIMEYAGSHEILELSSSSSAHHMDLHKDKATTATNKESRSRALYAKYFEHTSKVEDDDVVLADYKPPHPKPPIHNRRT